jgi:hypothetical protein
MRCCAGFFMGSGLFDPEDLLIPCINTDAVRKSASLGLKPETESPNYAARRLATSFPWAKHGFSKLAMV